MSGFGDGAGSSPTIPQLFRKNAWYTIGELAEASKAPPWVVRRVVDELYSKARIMPIALPGGGAQQVWHRTTRGARRLSEQDPKPGMIDLPWQLKRTLVAKADELHRRGVIKRAPPPWVRAILSLEDHLRGLGLEDTRVRPVEGFQYPCNWLVRASAFSHWPNSSLGAYAYELAFEGTVQIPLFISRKIFPGYFGKFPHMKGKVVQHSQSIEFDEVNASVTIREDQAHIILDRVGRGLVDEETLRVVYCSSRKEIIEKTAQKITANSEEWRMLQPFIPLPYKIHLIGKATPRAEEAVDRA